MELWNGTSSRQQIITHAVTCTSVAENFSLAACGSFNRLKHANITRHKHSESANLRRDN